jgi:hypothetical protein
MVHQKCLQKTEVIIKKPRASVVPIHFANGVSSSKQHGKNSNEKAKKDLPLFYTRPIYKAKEHDPL